MGRQSFLPEDDPIRQRRRGRYSWLRQVRCRQETASLGSSMASLRTWIPLLWPMDTFDGSPLRTLWWTKHSANGWANWESDSGWTSLQQRSFCESSWYWVKGWFSTDSANSSFSTEWEWPISYDKLPRCQIVDVLVIPIECVMQSAP